ncbi:25896_t:CDS:1 [Dentiscutata erythropus]|uniref:25896_t:CDS:1 n=1 Tax=Dentiscutata erythropus TaxID=1348616 RepID=A0A9N8ZBI4_9GLOM|nr:25896_t:CDS:1 [Dentiscutata erythropus]
MLPFKTVQNFYLIVLVVTLIAAYYTIVVVEASPEYESPGVNNQTNNETNVRTEGGDSKICKDDNKLTEEQANELQELIHGIFYTVFFIFKFIFSSIFTVVYQILRPIIFLIKQIYHTFFVVPFGFMKLAFLTVYPVFTFLAVAALLGICFGGTAGWISEVIVGVLTTPVNDEEPITTEVDNRRRMAKLKKRAAALANLKARNGGKLPEEYYSRFANGRPAVTRKGSSRGYEKIGYENGYKGYSSAGVGD